MDVKRAISIKHKQRKTEPVQKIKKKWYRSYPVKSSPPTSRDRRVPPRPANF
ncbi:hypothetical protein B0T26DRAFT_723128 [Lasiosphaeria miniovina]|uniref:Uncharacterized protein n=1 Tax=Lasiosphaeria miniovina TaxID=1954250 RepID=A0AA40DQS0_9PEZI|nr:uncharacterized protein B0T26DRAFT_723128 [Lasiosphaeria miniovina]KAK0709807.1 hypothetical protein B0T26DRAFT_723128 [Lasiosphaeria miniovina]